MTYKARLNADGQFDTEATLDLIDEIIRDHAVGVQKHRLAEALRELFEDALTVSNSECYDDGLSDAQIQARKDLR